MQFSFRKAAQKLSAHWHKPEENSSALWIFPTVAGADPFDIELNAWQSINPQDQIVPPYHTLTIAITGLRHPYVAMDYGMMVDEEKNPALLPATQYTKDLFLTALANGLNAEQALRPAICCGGEKFVSFANGTGEGSTLHFNALRKKPPFDTNAVSFEKVKQLFETVKQAIDTAQPVIQAQIDANRALQPPLEDWGVVARLEFEAKLADAVAQRRMALWHPNYYAPQGSSDLSPL